MAITIIAEPQDFTPAYNECKFIVDSTNVNNVGFRYIFDIYESGTSNKIAEYRILPDLNGYGEQDLSKLLSNQVTYDFNPTITTFYVPTNSYYSYDVKFGEEYLTTTSYTSSLTNSSGNVRINVTNTFVVGDQVNISQADGGVANPTLEGLHTVIAQGVGYFVVDALWSDVTDATINGDVTYADNRKTITRDITTTLRKFVFNGAVKWIDFPIYDETDYTLDNANGLWLTNQPLSFHCTLGQDLWLNLKNNANFTLTNRRIYFENSNGDVFYKILGALDFMYGVAVGCNNFGTLTLVSGTADLIKSDTEYYDFWYTYNASATERSERYRIYIDRRILISETHVLFLDRMGSLSSFAFQLKNYERGNITRELYNKDVTGYVSSGQWKYQTYEQGFVNYNTQVTTSYDLNTNWMTENEGIYFQELLSSPQTWVKNVTYRVTDDLLNRYDEDGCIIRIPESTEYVSCNVTTNSFEVFKQRNKNLIKQSISIRLSNNDIING